MGGAPPGAVAIRNTLPPNWQTFLLGMVIFLVAAPAIVAPLGQDAGYTPNLHITAVVNIFGMLTLALYTIARMKQSAWQVPRSPATLPLVLLFAWATLSTLWSTGSYSPLLDTLVWLGGLMAFLAVLLIVRSRDAQIHLLTAIALAGFAVGALGVLQHLYKVDWVLQASPPAGTLGNKNVFGDFLIATAPAAFALFLASTTRIRTWLFAAATATILCAIIFIRSKGSFAAIFTEAALFVILAFYVRSKTNLKLLAGVEKKIALALIVLVSVATLVPNIPTILNPPAETESAQAVDKAYGEFAERKKKKDLQRSERDKAPIDEATWRALREELAQSTIVVHERSGVIKHFFGKWSASWAHNLFGPSRSGFVRLNIWFNSYYMWRDHWLFGAGMGSWANLYPVYQSAYLQDTRALGHLYHAQAHNDYIEIICELGVIGLGLFLWLLFGIFKLATRALVSFNAHNRGSSSTTEAFMLAPVVAVGGIAVSALFSYPFYRSVTVALICAYLAVLSLNYATARGGLVKEFNFGKQSIRTATAFIVSSIAIAVTVLHYNMHNAETHYRAATYYLQNNSLKESLIEIQQSFEYGPVASPQAKRVKALALAHTGKLHEAMTLIDEILVDRPYATILMINKATILQQLRRYREAGEVLAELAKVQKVPKHLRLSGRFFETAGQFGKAAEAYRAMREHVMASFAVCDPDEDAKDGANSCEYIAKKLRRIGWWIERAEKRAASET